MLLTLGNLNTIKTKYETAKAYLEQNFSIIPVQGNKRSAVKWKAFQQQQPTLAQVQQWFGNDSQLGIGIVTGRISGIAVLDFDTETAHRTFCKKFPHLTQTYTVKTRRCFHLYFQILENIRTRSLKGQGIDWQFEGRYVVAPPTPGYEIAANLPILTVTQEDINAIEGFVKPKSQVTISDIQTQHITKEELIGYYTKHSHVGQRNDTLFKTGMLARDYGWSLQETIKLLSSPHAHNRHYHENFENRLREAVATLNSVFSRPPRQLNKWRGLPNLIREKLFKMKQTCTVRTWEGLIKLGYLPGMYASHDEAWAILKGIVGKHSIRKSFTATNEEGRVLFELVESHENPSPRTLPHANAASYTPKGITKNAFVSQKKPEEMKNRGRKSKYYRIPSVSELAEILGVRIGVIRDELTLDDLKSAKLTRMAAHCALIRRRPGKYLSKWLAKRLGVTVITKNTYDKEIKDLHKRATYTMKRIYTRTLCEIPDDLDVPGMFLEDDSGKRWPARQVIAAKLLKQGRRVTLMKQGVNYYWVGSRFDKPVEQIYFTPPKPSKVTYHSQNVLSRDQSRVAAYWSGVYDSSSDAHKQPHTGFSADLRDLQPNHSSESRKPLKRLQQDVKHHKSNHNPRRTFRDNDLEEKAQYLQKRINRMVNSAEQYISLRSVRKLMIENQHKDILKVIKRVEKRNNVENPPGLIITILRSDKRVRELQQMIG